MTTPMMFFIGFIVVAVSLFCTFGHLSVEIVISVDPFKIKVQVSRKDT